MNYSVFDSHSTAHNMSEYCQRPHRKLFFGRNSFEQSHVIHLIPARYLHLRNHESHDLHRQFDVHHFLIRASYFSM